MSKIPTPITRKDHYLAKIAGDEPTLPPPLTREEKYLAKIAGEDVDVPPYPIPRTEQYLAAILENGGGGAEVEALTVTQNDTYTAPEGKAYSPVTVNVPNTYAAGDEGKVVSSGELVSQSSSSVTENGTVDTTLINSLAVNVNGSSWVKLGEWERSVSTTSTSWVDVDTFNINLSDINCYYCVVVRNKAGRKNNCEIGSDTWFYPSDWWLYPSQALTYPCVFNYKNVGDGSVKLQMAGFGSSYGIVAQSLSPTELKIKAKYNSSYTGTIDDTFVIRLFKVTLADNMNPFTI